MRFLTTIALAICTTTTAFGQTEFDFKDPKGVNSVSFTVDGDLEPIVGTASGITGKVTFDPAKPQSLTGSIVIDSSSVKTTNSGMERELHKDKWLGAKEHDSVEFKVVKVKKAKKKKDGVFQLLVEGEFTMKGTTKTMDVPVEVKHLPGRLGDRMKNKQGDLLVLRSDFTIKRSDFGVGEPMPIVKDEIEIRVSIVGLHMED